MKHAARKGDGFSPWHSILLGQPDARLVPACPPEDVGGPWGYGEFLAAIADPRNAQHDEMLERVGGAFDPDEFDLEAMNARLSAIR